MHHQTIPTPTLDDAHWDACVLDLLVHHHPGLWSVEELKRVGGNALAVEDALTRLRALGLVHPVGDCVFATRAAAHLDTLAAAA